MWVGEGSGYDLFKVEQLIGQGEAAGGGRLGLFGVGEVDEREG